MDVKFNRWYINKNSDLPYRPERVKRLKLKAPINDAWAKCEFMRYDGEYGKSVIGIREFNTFWKLENIQLENK